MTYFALQAVEETIKRRLSLLGDADRLLIRNSVWLRFTTLTDPPIHTRNKIALLLTLVFIHDFPDRWPSFFDDLISTISVDRQTLAVDLLLRTCVCIDDEVVCRLINRSQASSRTNSSIKDAMRANGIVQLVDFWLVLLDRYKSLPNTINAILTVIARFSSWIDASLLINDAYFQKLNIFLNYPETRGQAIECLLEITVRGSLIFFTII